MHKKSTACPLSIGLKKVSKGMLINGYNSQKIFQYIDAISNKLKVPYLFNLRNFYFIYKIAIYNPNCIFISNGKFINPIILLISRILNKKVIIYFGDNMRMKHNNFIGYEFLIKISNLTFTVDCPSYKINKFYNKIKYINKFSRFHPQFNSNPNYEFDVIFVGTYEYKRSQYIKFLLENNINVTIFGGNWDSFLKQNKGLYEKEIYEIKENLYSAYVKKAKISLCFLRQMNKDCQTSRPYELAALSSCILSEPSKKLRAIFRDKEDIFFFNTKKELLFLVKKLLNDKELALKTGQNACRKIISDQHTCINRSEEIFSEIKKL